MALFPRKPRSQKQHPIAPTPGGAQASDARVLEIGRDLLSRARAHKAGLLSARFYSDRLMDWSMKDHEFKVQLFRFVDAFPMLATPEAVHDHLVDYLTQPGVALPPGLDIGLKVGGVAKGLAAKTISNQITAMARKFIAGTDARSALPGLKKLWSDGIAFSVDLLGEACLSNAEADAYRDKYLDLVQNLPDQAASWKPDPRLESDHLGPIPRTNVSIKISSLSARCDPIDPGGAIEDLMSRLVPILEAARDRGVLVNFDMEQFALKDLTIDLFERCCQRVDFHAGIALQAYLKSGPDDARRLCAWARRTGRIITVRLVKGAYWDYETIHAEETGWPCPVWNRKWQTDACFEQMTDIFLDHPPSPLGGEGRGEGSSLPPSPLGGEGRGEGSSPGGIKLALGSHNVRSIAHALAGLESRGLPPEAIEIQMLHGMADQLKHAAAEMGLRVREYVPVGQMIPGMAYLVRRLLENTSNESWLKAGFLDNADPETLLAPPSPLGGEGRVEGLSAPSPRGGEGRGEGLSAPSPRGGEGRGEGLSAPSPRGGEGRGEGSSAPSPRGGEGRGEGSSAPSPRGGEGRGEGSSAPSPRGGEGRGEGLSAPSPLGGEGRGEGSSDPSSPDLCDIAPERHSLTPAVPEIGADRPFFNEPTRDFSIAARRDAFAEAIRGTRLPAPEPLLGADQARALLATAFEAFPHWRDTSQRERSSILVKAATAMRARRDELAGVMIAEAGKTWREADADICEAIDFCDYYARMAVGMFDRRRLGRFIGELDETWYQPKGVALVISPWNFPSAIFTGMTTAALVTGNCAIVKPARPTVAIARLITEILWQAGVPRDVLHFCNAPGSTVAADLVRDPRVAMIAFTGSKQVGLDIIRAAAEHHPEQRHVKKIIAEMGGKNAIIVDTSADLDEAVMGVRYSAFGYQGQKCSACSRCIVVDPDGPEGSATRTFLRRLVEATRSLIIGDPAHPATDVGPVINAAAADTIRRYIQTGIDESLRVELDMPLPDADPFVAEHRDRYVGPVIFSGVTMDHTVGREEIFGPVLAVFHARTFDEALTIANASEYKLTGGVYSRKPSHIERAKRDFRVGNLYINRGCTGALVGRQPFGGFGLSGVGTKAGGADYLLHFTDPRASCENTMRRGFAPEL